MKPLKLKSDSAARLSDTGEYFQLPVGFSGLASCNNPAGSSDSTENWKKMNRKKSGKIFTTAFIKSGAMISET